MPPRLSKRQQRELEEIHSLASVQPGPSIPNNEEDEEVIPSPQQLHSGGGFSALFVPDDDPEDEEEETGVKTSKPRKSKKKKKKAVQSPVSVVDVATSKESPKDHDSPKPPTPQTPKSEKKAAKKAKAKEKKSADDEIDQALAELSLQYPASQKPSQSTEGRPSLNDLLSVSLQYLDADAEMRRFFGSKVVLASKTGDSSSTKVKKPPQGVRSHLTRPPSTWRVVNTREGLSLRSYTEEEATDKRQKYGWVLTEEKWWTVEYSKKYKVITMAFMRAVMAGDPQGLFNLLAAFPWHADTLLQVAEVHRHREEYSQAVDFVDRTLFTYERCFMGAFNFTSGLNRLDFDRVENRPFFLALHRQIADLQRRGCVRTSFEFAKLLYGLDPGHDPHGALFHLEYLAIKAGMHQWLLDVYDFFEANFTAVFSMTSGTRLNPFLLPGWAYSRALALKIVEDNKKETDHTKSIAALKEAAHNFPSIVPLLADKLDVTLPTKLRAHHEFKIETDAQSLSEPVGILHLLSHLYAQRAHPVWKDHAAWFSSVMTETFSDFNSPRLPYSDRKTAFFLAYKDENIRYSIYRHVLVLESSYRRLFSFIPRQVFSGKALACDPLPPPSAESAYNHEFFNGVDGSDDFYPERPRRGLAFRRQFEAFFEANPHIAQHVQGGVDEFLRLAGELPLDVLQEMLMDAAVDAVNAQGGMPGGLDAVVVPEEAEGAIRQPDANVVEVNLNPAPGAVVPPQPQREDEEGVEEDDEDEDEEDTSSVPRAFRNIIGRFFGTNTALSESSSEDEGVPLDDTGVD